MKRLYPIFITASITLAFILLIIWWQSGAGALLAEPRVPGLDNRPDGDAAAIDVTIGEFFETYATETTSSENDWPRFRGENFDNIVKDPTPLADTWPAEGPRIVWQHPLGEGHAAPVIKNGKVYLLDYDEKEKADVLKCYSLKTGTELWRRWYKVPLKRNHGMSRTIPAVTDKYLVTIGPRCHVMCMNPETGELLWTLDLEKEYGTETPFWYTGQCPLIYNDVAVLATGGKALLIGVDCETGNVLWETPNPDSIKMSHSSIIPFTLLGKEMFVYSGIGGTAGVSASESDMGKLLWMNKQWSPSVIAPSAVKLTDNSLLVLAGYGFGGGKIVLSKKGEAFEAVLESKHNPREGIASEQQTPILAGNSLWTIMPKDAGQTRNLLVRYDIKYIIADNKMYILNDDGELFMYQFNGTTVTLLARHKVLEGVDAWGPFAIADGYLIMRDSHNVICLDIGE